MIIYLPIANWTGQELTGCNKSMLKKPTEKNTYRVHYQHSESKQMYI